MELLGLCFQRRQKRQSERNRVRQMTSHRVMTKTKLKEKKMEFLKLRNQGNCLTYETKTTQKSSKKV